MTEEKHSPGPWQIKHAVGEYYDIETEQRFVAQTVHKQDVNLLAAAPDMLAVLTELIDMLLPTQAAQARLSQGVQSAVIRARTTIAKATGVASESKP